MAIENGWCYGTVYRCLKGGYSPTLYNQLVKPTRRKRRRFTADVSPEIITAYDAICAAEDVTRAELLAWMVRNHTEFNGTKDYAELPY